MKLHDKENKETRKKTVDGIKKTMWKCRNVLYHDQGHGNAIRKAATGLLAMSILCLSMGNLSEAAAENGAAIEGVVTTENGTAIEGVATTENGAAIEGVTAAENVVPEVNMAGTESHFDGWVQDDAGLLTAEEEEELEAECERLLQEHGTGVYIITTPDFGGGDIKDWQRQIFSQYNLGADSAGSGVMLAISMAERDWGLVGFGAAQEAFSTYARERLGSLILDDLSDGEFYKAFSGYLSIADDYLSAEEEGNPYTEQHRYREGWRFPVIFGVSFLLSLGISVAIVMIWKKGMNTRVRQNGAMEYLKAGSFYLSNQSDLFLYHTVSRTQRPKDDSSDGGGSMHSDSSGTSGKF